MLEKLDKANIKTLRNNVKFKVHDIQFTQTLR